MSDSLTDESQAGRPLKGRRLAAVHASTGKLVTGRVFLIPSLITVVGLFCGFLAIVSAVRGRFDYATGCIAVAFLLDGLDGRVARRLNATSAFGRELDSLSDVICFGVAPALLTYLWAFKSFADDFGLLIAFVFVACGAARLARFNVTTVTEPKKHFVGLPIPAAAAAICSAVHFSPAPIESAPLTAVLIVYMLILAGLMVSTFPFASVKHLKLTRSNIRFQFLTLSLVVALLWYNSHLFLLLGVTAYALSGPFVYLFRDKIPPESLLGKMLG